MMAQMQYLVGEAKYGAEVGVAALGKSDDFAAHAIFLVGEGQCSKVAIV